MLVNSFLIIYDQMSSKYGMREGSPSQAELVAAFGEPDESIQSPDGKQLSLVFGAVAFEYEEGVFKGRRWLPPFSQHNFSGSSF